MSEKCQHPEWETYEIETSESYYQSLRCKHCNETLDQFLDEIEESRYKGSYEVRRKTV